jgi:dimethylglycine dehydrogenase
MKAHAQVVVIGGGICGCSVLYYLARLGWTDSLLIEKSTLTSGMSWMAVGNAPQYSDNVITARVQAESLNEIERIALESGQPTGVHRCGGIKLARSEAQLDAFRRYSGIARIVGTACELIDATRAQQLFPYLEPDGVVGAVHMPDEGFADPFMTTQAFATAARNRGAGIVQKTHVRGLKRRFSGEWEIETDRGFVVCQFIVDAAGFAAGAIAGMAGWVLPIAVTAHQYLVTDAIEGLSADAISLPILRESNVPYYMRQEGPGLLVSTYWSNPPDTVFLDLAQHSDDPQGHLRAPDLDRVEGTLEATGLQIPILQETGIKAIYNAPIIQSPDQRGLIGPLDPERTFFVFGGTGDGFGQCVLARSLAEWIADGEPGSDISPFDLRRFGASQGPDFAIESLRECDHGDSVILANPQEDSLGEVATYRSPLRNRLAEYRTVFGVRGGWEVPEWCPSPHAGEPSEAETAPSAWLDDVRSECAAARQGAALIDLCSTAKFWIRGLDAERLVGRVCAGFPPTDDGRTVTTPMLTPLGRVVAIVEVTRRGRDRFLLTGSPRMERKISDWLHANVGHFACEIDALTDRVGAVGVFGPAANRIVERLGLRPIEGPQDDSVINGSHVLGRISVLVIPREIAGEPGCEFYTGIDDLKLLSDQLEGAAADGELRPIGWRAMDWLQLEAGALEWMNLFSEAYDALDLGLEDLIDLERGGFIGSEAVSSQAQEHAGPRSCFLLLDPTKSDSHPWGEEPVLDCGQPAGRLIATGYSELANRTVAVAILHKDHVLSESAEELTVEILGQEISALVSKPPALNTARERWT